MSHDPRSVANFLLDLAGQQELKITNLALQKLLYFAHAHFLIQTGHPLVQGAFEAWEHGPVHPAVYHAFKAAGRDPIRFRAEGRDVMTGRPRPLAVPTDAGVRHCIYKVLAGYGHLSPRRLVDISHAPRGPWQAVVDAAKTSVALGMRIPDSVTRERFMYLKVVVGAEAPAGGPYEDTPLAGD